MDGSDVSDQGGLAAKFAYEFASNPSAFEPGWSKILMVRSFGTSSAVVLITETYS